MRKLAAVTLNDLRLIFADGSAWINIVVVPLILSLVIGYSVNLMVGGDEFVPLLDVIDQDQSELSRSLVGEIARANPALVICEAGGTATLDPACQTEGAILGADRVPERLDDGVTSAYLLVPDDLEAMLAAGETGAITYRSRESLTQPSAVYAAVEAAAASAGAGMQAQRVAEKLIATLGIAGDKVPDGFFAEVRTTAQTQVAEDPFTLVSEPAYSLPEVNTAVNQGFAQSIPGIGSMYAVIATLAMVAAYVRDTKQGVIQRARTMAVRPAQLLGGKVLAYFAIGMIQLAILFTFGYFLGLRYGTNPFALVALMVSFTFAVTGLALFVTSLVTTDAQAQSIALLIGLTMGPIGGAWWSLQIVPSWMQTLGHVTPIAWAMDGYNALIYRDASWAGVALPMAVLVGMAALFFTLGVWRMSTREQ